MFRWMIVMVLALVLFSSLRPWLEKIGLGRLPGDFHFRVFGREFHLPIASSVLLSFIALAIGRFL